MPADGALIDMATHRGSATAPDGNQYFKVQPGEPGRRPINQSLACGAYDIGQLQEWPLHLLVVRRKVLLILWCRQRERVQRAGGGFEMPLGQMQIAAGCFQIDMAQQKLNGT